MSETYAPTAASRAVPGWNGNGAHPTGTWAVIPLFPAVLAAGALSLAGGRTDGIVVIWLVCLLCATAVTSPRWGYYLLVFLALLADDTVWGFSTLTHQLGFYIYENWWKLLSRDGVREFSWLLLNTIEVLILAVAVGHTARVFRGTARPVVTHESILTIAFLVSVSVMLAYGLATGGDLKPALWQVRPYFHLAAFALLAPQVLKTREHIRDLVWVLAAAVVIKALQIAWIFCIVEDGRFGDWREILGHEDSVFFVGVISLAVALTLYNVETAQRRFLQMTAALLLIALVVNLRRAGYVALTFSLGLIPAVLHGRRKAAIKLSIAMAAGVGFYCVLFWNVDSALGVPVQKLKSIVGAQTGSTDYSSNLYRVAERVNLRRMIIDHPMGVGFGHPFELHMPLPDISAQFPNWRYHPHDMILGMWISLGTVGFVVFLSYMGGILMLASHNLRRQEDCYIKAVCFFVLASIMSGFLVSAVDQFIWADRGAIFLGTMVGILSATSKLRPSDRSPQVAGNTGDRGLAASDRRRD